MSNPQQSAALELETASPAWKQEINARLSAHRSRRTGNGENQQPLPGMDGARRPETGHAAKVAARVAERYSKAPTYSEMLAAEAARAAEAAAAAAEAARLAHEAAAQAMNEALRARREEEQRIEEQRAVAAAKVAEPQPRDPEPERVQYRVHPSSLPEQRPAPSHQASQASPRTAATGYMDVFEETVVAPAQPLPVRILEFPRELVATRKARPRHAEGPLREESEDSQLRIFEVEPDSISREPISSDKEARANAPEWHSIRLDAHPPAHEATAQTQVRKPGAQASRRAQSSTEAPAPPLAEPEQRLSSRSHSLLDTPQLHIAPMEDRLMAAIVDFALVMVAFLLFVLVFVACTAHPPMGKGAMAAAGAVLVGFFVLYQWLFFTYAEGTPGMRYAKIALCTFDDENPTRRSMQWRIGGLLFSALPLGLGFLWTLFDEDRLGWHDRITHTYQRSYR